MFLKILLIIVILVGLVFIIKQLMKEKKGSDFQAIDFETRFTVIEIINGDTFKISPGWKWNNEKGDTIRPTGYDTPEKGEPQFQEMREKLKQLLLNKEIELKNPIKLSYNRLLCDVLVNGRNLAEFFEDYKA